MVMVPGHPSPPGPLDILAMQGLIGLLITVFFLVLVLLKPDASEGLRLRVCPESPGGAE